MTKNPSCPVCAPRTGKAGGRPRDKVRPDIRLSTAYVSRIGAECGQMAEIISAAAAVSRTEAAERDLAVVAEKLMRLKELFQ